MCATHVCSQRPKEKVRSPGAGGTVANHPKWVPGAKLGSSGGATAALLAAEPSSSSLAKLPKGCSPAKSPPLGTGERKWNVNCNNVLRHHRKRVEHQRERQSRLQMPRAQTTALALRPRGLPSLLTVYTFFTSETAGLRHRFLFPFIMCVVVPLRTFSMPVNIF